MIKRAYKHPVEERCTNSSANLRISLRNSQTFVRYFMFEPSFIFKKVKTLCSFWVISLIFCSVEVKWRVNWNKNRNFATQYL